MTWSGSGPYNDDIHYSTTPGTSAEFTFEGSQFTLVYTGYTNRGTVDVYVDDVLQGTLNQYSPTRVWQAEWASGDLGAGVHTVKFVHAGPSGMFVNIDAIDVQQYQPPGIGIYDDIDSGWTYTNFSSASSLNGPYAGTLHFSSLVGATAEFTFEGSQIILTYSRYSNRGNLEVYVDDVLVDTINQYNAMRIWLVEWTSGDLGAGTHTVRFVHVGPSGSAVDIDAIEIKTYEPPPPPPGTGKYNDTDAGWNYSSGWMTWSGSGPYNDDIHYSSTAGNMAEFTFEGSQFILVYTGYTNRGTVDVYVDDVLQGTLNQYSASRAWQAEWASGDLGAGVHTVRFENTGPAGKLVDIDAIEIKTYEPPPPPPGTGKYNDTDAGWNYSNGWMTWSGSGPYNDDIHYSTTPGTSAEFTFEGSQFTLVYTGYTNRGTVDVYVDDVLQGTLNQYSPTRVWQAEWASGDLGAGVHTVKFVHAGPSGMFVDIDAIDVQQYQPPGIGIYDDMDSGWTYTNFSSASSLNGPYAGTLHFSSLVGATAEFTFEGSQIILTYSRYSNRGNLEVYVDDVLVDTINQYNAMRIWLVEWTSGDLGAGTHTVRFVHVGPSGSAVDIDAIEIKTYEPPPPPPGTGKYNDTDAGWNYSSGWMTWSGSGPYNDDIHYSSTAGNMAEFTFEGSQFILVYTGYTNRGTVDVYVDDVLQGTLNQYSASRAWQAEWASGDLGAGVHTVRLVHTSGSIIDIDAIEIDPST